MIYVGVPTFWQTGRPKQVIFSPIWTIIVVPQHGWQIFPVKSEFLEFARQQEHCRLQWLNQYKESRRLQKELDASMKTIGELETKLYHARRILDQECKARREAEDERDSIVSVQLVIVEFIFRFLIGLEFNIRNVFAWMFSFLFITLGHTSTTC